MPQLTDAYKYQRWLAALKANGLDVHGVEEIYTKFRHDDDVLFSLVLLDATTPEGDKIPPICFIKGDIVCVMVVLIDEATGEKYNLLVRQRRICNGDYIYEQVAGMVDGSDKPHDVAVREVAEETGIEVDPAAIIPLNDEVIYPSTGTSDEAMYFYYCELKMSREQIFSYHEKQTGVISEHERIITHVATIPEAMKLIKNVNGILNIHMYQAAIGE
ncbi:MAG: NUDIX hydrolase [Bacteroidota bacterium]